MKLRLEPLEQTEFVHYASADLLVTSWRSGSRCDMAACRATYDLPVSAWERPILPYRLLRRASRLDKCNVLPIFEDGALTALVAVRQGRIYRVEYPSGKMAITLRLRALPRGAAPVHVYNTGGPYLFWRIRRKSKSQARPSLSQPGCRPLVGKNL